MRKPPQSLISHKPDWQAGEVINPRVTDYYRSECAVSQMYRAISLEDAPPASGTRVAPILSTAVKRIVQPYLCVDINLQAFPQHVEDTFQRFHDEMHLKSVTHTLTSDQSVRLTEEEIVVSTILPSALSSGCGKTVFGTQDTCPGTGQGCRE
jgi:RNA-dependent RNA polymerase